MKDQGSKIRKIRKMKEKKQPEIAQVLGISTRQYRKLENDELDIKKEYIDKLAHFYEMSIEQIESFEDKNIVNQTINNSGENNQGGHFYNENKKLVEHLKDAWQCTIDAKNESIRILNDYIFNLKS